MKIKKIGTHCVHVDSARSPLHADFHFPSMPVSLTEKTYDQDTTALIR